MSPESELDPTDYHLRLMIEQMQRDGRSEDAIEGAVRIASGWKQPTKMAEAHDSHPDDRHSTTAGQRR
jgi:hypothetical protein